MNNRRNEYNFIASDKGSTLITVIVAIAFVTILTSIILGTTVVNVRMKGIDKRTKDDFYYAEKALNDIYTGMGQELAIVAGKKYDETFQKLGLEVGGVDYGMAEKADEKFREIFMTAILDGIPSVEDPVDPVIPKDPGALKHYLQGFITSRGTVDKVGTPVYEKKDGNPTTDASKAFRVVLNDVQVSDTDSSGYRAVITTDIVINIPTLDFLGTNADISDYGLIANEGLYITCDSDSSKSTLIDGNVYAGVYENTSDTYPTATDIDYPFYESTDKNAKGGVYGGINIEGGKAVFTGNSIVSKGNINISGKNTIFQVNPGGAANTNLTNLWFTSLRTISDSSVAESTTGPEIDINANVFALNDLAINADNSVVTIKGNYYGYNDKTLPNNLNSLGVDRTKREDGVSSAIVINGKKATLDMKDIQNFVLMGKAYIDFTSDESTNATSSELTSQIVPTTEGVALKTNQQLYLVPPDFLDGANPVENDDSVGFAITKSNLKNWFGYKYLDYGNNKDDPDLTRIHKKYKLPIKGSTSVIYYDYLVFDESKTWKRKADGSFEPATGDLGTGGSVSSKAAFFYEIMSSKDNYDAGHELTTTQPSAYRLYERIERSISNNEYFDLKKCVVGNNAADAHYYAKNAIVNYEEDASDPDKIKSKIFVNNEGMGRFVGYTQNLYHRYIWLCTRLDAKDNKRLDEPPGDPGTTEWVVTYPDSKHAAPICHFINTGEIATPESDEISRINNTINTANSSEYGLKKDIYGVVIATKKDLDLGYILGTDTTFKGVAIVDGDITVPYGVDVYGLLMATGKIFLKGNNEIHYDKGLIQSRIEKEINLIKTRPYEDHPYRAFYLIKYLSKEKEDGSGSTRLYKIESGSRVKREQIEADYNDFMHYENWQKGEAD